MTPAQLDARRWRWLGLGGALLAHLVLGAWQAVVTPEWQVPDEPAHYAYLRSLVEQGRLPILSPGDYHHAELAGRVADGFPEPLERGELEYESHQPPLYYLLAAPVYALGSGSSLALRLFSVLLGAGVVALAWLIAQRLAPGWRGLAPGAAWFVALLPQFGMVSSGISNDVLTVLLATALLHAAMVVVQAPSSQPITGKLLALGVLLGLGLLTKASLYLLAPLAALAAGWQARDPRRSGASAMRCVLLVLVPAALIAAPWWLRNVLVYGWNDPLGLLRHAQVAADQPSTADWIAASGVWPWLMHLVGEGFRSFWGQLGWMSAPVAPWALLGFALSTTLALAAIALPMPVAVERRALVLCLLQALLCLAGFVAYNLAFVQPQGRYLFPALVPIALALVAGWLRWSGAHGRSALALAALAIVPASAAWLVAMGSPGGFGALLVLTCVAGVVASGRLRANHSAWLALAPLALLAVARIHALVVVLPALP